MIFTHLLTSFTLFGLLAIANFSLLQAQSQKNNNLENIETTDQSTDQKTDTPEDSENLENIEDILENFKKTKKDFSKLDKSIKKINKEINKNKEKKPSKDIRKKILKAEKKLLKIIEDLERYLDKEIKNFKKIKEEETTNDEKNQQEIDAFKEGLEVLNKQETIKKINKELLKANNLLEEVTKIKEKYKIEKTKILAPFSQTHEKYIPEFVFEVEGGINFATTKEETMKKNYNLERFGSKVAMSWGLKNGLLFNNHYLVALGFSYDKLRDFNYNLNAIQKNMKRQTSYKKYSLGFDTIFFFWPFSSKYNLAFALNNHGAMIVNRITQINAVKYINKEGEIAEKLLKFYAPKKKITLSYFFKPELRFYIRLTPISALYFAFAYNVIEPASIYYPSFMIGLDTHFNLYKDPKEKKEY